ncbi:MAG: transcriptional repressor [Acidobacteria bacterium]|nr:transcriptional repressor [Acidobacteriota bacterium]
MTHFVGQCRLRKLAVTPQRLAIYGALARTDAHPTAEGLYRAIHVRYPTISLATVYKTLETLEREGLISRFSFLHQAARYDANQERHHHRVCIQCGRVEDFTDRALDRLPTGVHQRRGFKVLAQLVQVNGLCRRCKHPAGRSVRPT